VQPASRVQTAFQLLSSAMSTFSLVQSEPSRLVLRLLPGTVNESSLSTVLEPILRLTLVSPLYKLENDELTLISPSEPLEEDENG
jgi:hypothetical protein